MKQVLYLTDIEMSIRERIRDKPLYARLSNLLVLATEQEKGGWTAHFEGAFAPTEKRFLRKLISGLQNRYQLNTHPDPCHWVEYQRRLGVVDSKNMNMVPVTAAKPTN